MIKKYWYHVEKSQPQHKTKTQNKGVNGIGILLIPKEAPKQKKTQWILVEVEDKK